MSSTTRSMLPGAQTAGRVSCRSPTVSVQFSGTLPEKATTLPVAISANSSRRSKEKRAPSEPTPLSRCSDRAPDPTPASTTRAPGKMSASERICAASFGYTMAAPRGIDMTKSESRGRSARYSSPLLLTTTDASGRPTISACGITPRWLWNSPARTSVIVLRRPFGPVSCTRSPYWNGPRTAGASPAAAATSTPASEAVRAASPRRAAYRSLSASASTPSSDGQISCAGACARSSRFGMPKAIAPEAWAERSPVTESSSATHCAMSTPSRSAPLR